MFERIKALRARLHELAEVAEMTERDLDDLGLTRDQMRTLLDIPKDVPDRVGRMAEVFGITMADLSENRSELVEVLGLCAQCQTRAECAHEMAKGDAADPEACGFCVNAGTFAEHARSASAT